jgi:hypothetical protein
MRKSKTLRDESGEKCRCGVRLNGSVRQAYNIPALTFLETKLVGKIDQHVLDLLLGQRDVGILTPRRLSKKNKRRRRRFFCFSYDRERQEKT